MNRPARTAADGAVVPAAAPTWPARALDAVLGVEPKVRRLTTQTLTASVPYLVQALLVAYVLHRGWMSPGHAGIMLGGMAANALLLWLVLRSGRTLHLRDPSIGLLQVLASIGWCTVGYVWFARLHESQMLLLVIVMSVAMGVLYLDTRRMLIACCAGLALLASVTVFHCRRGVARDDARVEWVNLGVIMACAPTMVAVAAQLAAMRKRLRRQRSDLQAAVQRLRDLAIKDELTGLYNRHHAAELFTHHIKRHDAGLEGFAVALLDIDHFKRVNDTHGHSVGDEVLRAFAAQAGHILRKSDVLVRWGGEEFALVCPGQDLSQTTRAVERLHEGVRRLEAAPSVPGLRITFSAGIVAHHPAESLEQTMGRADAALYRAKGAGRNCSVTEGSVTEASPAQR